MPSPKKKIGGGYGCLWVLIAAGSFLLLIGMLMAFSSIRGTEFCPNTFQAREFAYSRIPGTGVRLTSTQLGNSSSVAHGEVLKHLRTLPQQVTWHVATVSGWRSENHAAQILVETLRQTNADGKNFWGKWSFDHPTLAAVFWPLVQDVAFHELYGCVPELMEHAEQAKDPPSLERKVIESIADAVIARIHHAVEDSEIQSLVDWFEGLSATSGSDTGWLTQLKDRVQKASRSP
ncbi:MAG: hypothetical protein MUF23_12985 [Pirellula sp.]|jgi:hypothetical protein|nr:hypothetical protein [Pirellula sp.]